ncbi:MAG: YchJ family protein [Jatrophihabitans sp.]|uniref:YchJ family protein n=1 Tax=Jatrophihabitans sp. TaxID=1932789 RepID=UPI003F7E1AFB
MAASTCPCGTGGAYAECCGPLHAGTRRAATAGELMRSRYSAFAVGDVAYLVASWHPTTRPASIELDPAQRWTRLEILAERRGGPDDSAGVVEFRAHYRQHGADGVLHERSSFVRDDGAWRYVAALPR